MLSDVTSKTYEDLKREAADKNGWAEEIVINPPLRVEDRMKKED